MRLYAVGGRLSAQIGEFGVIVTPNLPIDKPEAEANLAKFESGFPPPAWQ
jgi:hypothetical protein